MSEKIQELENLVRHHSKKYFEEFSPEISDREFDRLVEQLRKLSPTSAALDEIKDSQWFNRFDPVTRKVPMLSLEKVYNLDDLEKWFNTRLESISLSEKKIPLAIAMPKIDGCAISLIYKNGLLKRAATRGDGYTGEDVTLNVRNIYGIPDLVPSNSREFEVRGEIFIPIDKFERFKDKFSNPRNLAAGVLHKKFPSECRDYGLEFVAYSAIGYAENYPENLILKGLVSENFQVIPIIPIYEVSDLLNAISRIETWSTRPRSSGVDYELDGVVIKLNDPKDQKKFGYTSHHPRYAIAYKFPGDEGQTTLESIEWQVSRSGRINPVALVYPITLSGASIAKISLHSLGQVVDMNLSRGDQVLISRRGGVIPHLERKISNENSAEPFKIPNTCPDCGGDVWHDKEYLYCKDTIQLGGDSCLGAQTAKMVYFLETVGCEGFGPATVKILLANKLVQSPIDFWLLDQEILLALDEFGPKQIENLLTEIGKCEEISLENLLCAIGIPGLGSVKSKEVAKRFQTLEALFDATVADFMKMDGIASLSATQIKTSLETCKEFLMPFSPLLKAPSLVQTSNKLSGKKFIITGTLNRPRAEVEKDIESNGGSLSSSISKNLDFLIVGQDPSESKIEKANKLAQKTNLKIITEEDLNEMILRHLL